LIRAVLLSTLLAGAAIAQTLEPVEEVIPLDWFETYAEGFTLHFEQDGALAGSEMFLPDRRVKWQFPNGMCINGIWYEEAGAMCFAYETGGPPQCWHMIREGEDIFARPADATDTSGDIRMTRRTVVPLSCGGPALGA
jgi:hypothetical protein